MCKRSAKKISILFMKDALYCVGKKFRFVCGGSLDLYVTEDSAWYEGCSIRAGRRVYFAMQSYVNFFASCWLE